MKLTLKEYATMRGVSYENVRLQVNKYYDELKDFIEVENKTKILTDQAQEILNSKSKKQVVVLEGKETIKIKELNDEIKKKDKKIEELLKEIDRKDADHEKELIEKDATINQITNKYNNDREEYLNFRQEILETQKQLYQERAETRLLITQSENKVAEKDKELNLIATNRKERRKYLKDLKKKAKEEKQQAKEQAANDTQSIEQ